MYWACVCKKHEVSLHCLLLACVLTCCSCFVIGPPYHGAKVQREKLTEVSSLVLFTTTVASVAIQQEFGI